MKKLSPICTIRTPGGLNEIAALPMVARNDPDIIALPLYGAGKGGMNWITRSSRVMTELYDTSFRDN
jgi:hypothetical protein